MLDTDFKIERPKRVYRQGFSLLHHGPAEDRREGSSCDAAADIPITVAGDSSDQGGTLRSIKFGLSRLFHPDRTRHIASTHSLPTPMQSHARSNSGSSSSFAMSVDSEDEEGPTTLMVDPSTNVDPLRGETASQDEMNPTLNKDGIRQESSKNKKRVKDVSMHTFFIENSQMRLKLFARNTVGPSGLHDVQRCEQGCPIVSSSVRCSNGLRPLSALPLRRIGYVRIDSIVSRLSDSTSLLNGLSMV